MAFKAGVLGRLRFLWRCLMAALEEIGRVAQDNRLVGAFVVGSALIAGLSVGAAVLAIFVFETVIPAIVVPSVVVFLVSAEGAYLEWRVARSSPPIADTVLAEKKRTEIADDEMGLLDYVPESIRAIANFSGLLARLSKSMVRAAKRMTTHSAQMDRTQDPSRKQRLAIRTAEDIDKHSEVFEAALPILRAAEARFGKGQRGLVDTVLLTGQQDRAALKHFRETVVGFKNSIVVNKVTMTEYRQATVGLRARNLSADINRAAERHERSATTMVDLLTEIDASCKKTLDSIDARLRVVTPRSKSGKGGSRRG